MAETISLIIGVIAPNLESCNFFIRSFIKVANRIGLNTDPCSTPLIVSNELCINGVLRIAE